MAHRRSLTNEEKLKIIESIQRRVDEGVPLITAARTHGISPCGYHNWIKQLGLMVRVKKKPPKISVAEQERLVWMVHHSRLSGSTLREACRQVNITDTTYYSWIRQLGLEERFKITRVYKGSKKWVLKI